MFQSRRIPKGPPSHDQALRSADMVVSIQADPERPTKLRGQHAGDGVQDVSIQADPEGPAKLRPLPAARNPGGFNPGGPRRTRQTRRPCPRGGASCKFQSRRTPKDPPNRRAWSARSRWRWFQSRRTPKDPPNPTSTRSCWPSRSFNSGGPLRTRQTRRGPRWCRSCGCFNPGGPRRTR